MTAEKGEHERATPVCESRPTSLRATLRAPPSKWAIKAFFPAGERSEPRSRTAPKGLPQTEARDAQRGGPPLESPCRLLSLVLSFASKESTSPFGAEASLFAPESARQSPGVGFLPAKLAHIDAYSWLSARPLQPFGSSAGANQQPNGAASPTPRRSRRVSPPAGECFRQSRRTPTQTGVLPRGKQPARLALSCAPFAAYLNSELFPLVTFRTHRRQVSAAANENDQHVQNTRWSFL